MNIEPIPDFVSQVHAAAGPLVIALIVCIGWLVIENWPELPKNRNRR